MITDGLNFAGRVAIVTGGATDIAYATALQLAQLGAAVVIASRTVEELEAAAAQISNGAGARCMAIATDVKEEAAVSHLVEKTVADLGRVDVLINNAGGTRLGPLEEIPTRGRESIFNLNVRSAYLCTREAGKHMIAQKSGAIVNISSTGGIRGVKGGRALFGGQVGIADVHHGDGGRMGTTRHPGELRCRRHGRLAAPPLPRGRRRAWSRRQWRAIFRCGGRASPMRSPT
jgi:NAD(P)-dependent dehydrogenase (short-subunit alcohol dehydrogenase family)